MTELAHPGRVLVTGWPSFLHGEATAGDVLAMEAVRRAAVLPRDAPGRPAQVNLAAVPVAPWDVAAGKTPAGG